MRSCANAKKSMVVREEINVTLRKESEINGVLGALFLGQLMMVLCVCCWCRNRRAKKMIGRAILKRSKEGGKWTLSQEDMTEDVEIEETVETEPDEETA